MICIVIVHFATIDICCVFKLIIRAVVIVHIRGIIVVMEVLIHSHGCVVDEVLKMVIYHLIQGIHIDSRGVVSIRISAYTSGEGGGQHQNYNG